MDRERLGRHKAKKAKCAEYFYDAIWVRETVHARRNLVHLASSGHLGLCKMRSNAMLAGFADTDMENMK